MPPTVPLRAFQLQTKSPPPSSPPHTPRLPSPSSKGTGCSVPDGSLARTISGLHARRQRTVPQFHPSRTSRGGFADTRVDAPPVPPEPPEPPDPCARPRPPGPAPLPPRPRPSGSRSGRADKSLRAKLGRGWLSARRGGEGRASVDTDADPDREPEPEPRAGPTAAAVHGPGELRGP